jgi:oxygen-independent coproporphyrinogen-3 oxidase
MDTLKTGNLPIFDEHQVSRREQIEEEMFLGLRKTAGVSITRFMEKFSENPVNLFKNELEELIARGLINVTGEEIHLSYKGRFLGNEVFQYFLK